MHPLGRLAGLGLGLLALVLFVACAPPVGPGRPAPSPGVLGIGDSVMLGGNSALQAAIPGMAVDAVVSRQYSSLPWVVAWHAQHGLLPGTVVIHLGTNGPIAPATCDAVARQLGPRRVIFFSLTVPRSWQDANNVTLRACAGRSGAAFADWHAFSAGHREWFAADGYHLRATGARQYAALIASLIK